MKIILPPLITILLIAGIFIFLWAYPPVIELFKTEADFDILSPIFLIRNGALIAIGLILSFLFSGGITYDEGSKPEFKFLVPLVVGIAGGVILLLISKPIWYPKGSIYFTIIYVLVWVVAEELFFRSFLTKALMGGNEVSGGPNIFAYLVSSILYAFWFTTYYPILGSYNLLETLSIAFLFWITISIPVTGSYYYTRSLISSGITNLIIKAIIVGYGMFFFLS